jgi:hypothetical protein
MGVSLSLRVTGLSAGCGRLYALCASLSLLSLRATGVSAGYGRLCGLRASLRATGVSAGYGRLCGLRASLRVTGVSAGYGRCSLLVIVADLPVSQRSIRSTGISYSLRVMGFSRLLLRLLRQQPRNPTKLFS